MDCGNIWTPENPKEQQYCHVCEKQDYERVRCAPSADKPNGCYLDKLEIAMDGSAETSILNGIHDIENQLALKLTVTVDAVRADIFQGLLIFAEETARYHRENPKG